MFTGIIEKVGVIKRINQKEIVVQIDFDDLRVGDSISINGICLTLTDFIKNRSVVDCHFDISPETYSRTNLKYQKVNDLVNIERSLKLGSRLDGHIVTGHIDDVSKIISIKKLGDSYEFEFSLPSELNKFVAEKGSVALDGISLTVAKKIGSRFTVAVVPFTFQNTNLKTRKAGDFVNIEVDILARYVNEIIQNGKDKSKLKEILGENW